MTIHVDKGKYVKKLEEAGVSPLQAWELANALSEAMSEVYVDVKNVKLLNYAELYGEIHSRYVQVETDLWILKFMAAVVFVLDLLILLKNV